MGNQALACWKTGVTVIATLALAVAPTASAAGSPADRTVTPSTRANLLKAMHGEAFAYAKYRAYAVQAGRDHLPKVRDLYLRTATMEFREHFTEQADLVGLVGDDAANLREAINGETYESTTMYRRFAAQARADGDREAARRFAEIGRDEAAHRAAFATALKAITDPSSGAAVPKGPTAKPADIPAGPPRVSSPRTLRNLHTAMAGEAFAFASYTLFAERARAGGRPELAALFDRTAKVELTEHFAEQATLAGLVRDTRANLNDSIDTEIMEATRMYPALARAAAEAGDAKAASVLAHTGQDELRHARQFRRIRALVDRWSR